MENNKPISEWTLKEVQEMCDNQDDCPGCPFYTAENGCMFSGEAACWPLDEAGAVITPISDDIDALIKPDKPRLAEVLGVDEDEKWRYPGCAGLYRVHNGVREYWDENNGWLYCDCEEDLVKIIAHPESIIRAPRLTEAEIAIMRAVGAKWVSLDTSSMDEAVELWSDKPENDESGDFCSPLSVIAIVTAARFPSVKPGDCIGPIDTSTTAKSGN